MIATTRIIVAIFSLGFGLGIFLSYICFRIEGLKYRIQITDKMQESRLEHRNPNGIQYKSVAEVNAVMLGYSNGKFVPSEVKKTTTTTTIKPIIKTTSKPKTTVAPFSNHVKTEHLGDNLEALKLSNAVRVLCFILTSPSTHKEKAIHVKRTWGKRCTILLFVTTKADKDLEPVLIVKNVKEGRKSLWAKTKHAIREIYKTCLDKADWFLKADDDTYIVMENLRYMLRHHNPNETHYFGHTFHPKWLGYDYMSGGAGYLLSRGTIKRLVEEAFITNNSSECKPDHIEGKELSEDLEIGRCINHLKIPSSDSRDVLGRMRFFPFAPDIHISHKKLNHTGFDWWWEYTKYSHDDGLECCSDTAVGFHYVPPQTMYLYEYLLYHLRPFGMNRIAGPAGMTTTTTTQESVYSELNPDAIEQEEPSTSEPSNIHLTFKLTTSRPLNSLIINKTGPGNSTAPTASKLLAKKL